MNLITNLTTKRLGAIMLGVFSAGPVLAQSSAFSEISNIRFALTDLDLNDGITPSLTFSAPLQLSTSEVGWYISTVDPTSNTLESNTVMGASALAPVSTSKLHNGVTGTRVELTGEVTGGALANLGMFAGATANDAVGRVDSALSARTGIIDFVLSPMTRVSFFADASVEAAAGAIAGPGLRAAANGTAQMRFYPNTEASQESFAEYLLLHAAYGEPTFPGLQQTLTLSYANDLVSVAKQALFFEATATAYSDDIPSPVPEPATYAMLLGGLAMLAALRRRQCSKR